MKRVFILILVLGIFAGCANYRYVFSTTENKELQIYANDKERGIVKRDSVLLLNTQQNPSYLGEIKAVDMNSGEVVGKIEYTRNTDYKFVINNSMNAKEVKREHAKENDYDIITYYIEFGEGNGSIGTGDTYGYVKLTSNQKDVKIYVDGELVGKIEDEKPFNKKIPIGKHVIMAKKEYFMPYQISPRISENDIFAFHFELQNVKGWAEESPGISTVKQARGNLTVATERNDYKVYIEGYEKVPPFELKNMPAGIYNLRVVRPGFSKTISVSVDDGEDKFVDLDQVLAE